MENKRVLKKSIIKPICIIIGIIVVVLIVFLTYKHFTSSVYKLGKLGYSKEQAQEIVSLNKQDMVLTKEYNDKMVDLLKAKYYMEKNIDKYILYYNDNNDKSIDDIVAIVNVHADNEFYSDDHKADTSKGTSILVNKFYKLDSSYTPTDLVEVSNWYAYAGQKVEKEVYDEYKQMFNAAKDDGYTILINDSYRTLEEQQNSWDKYGDKYAARSGYSEHNTGLAVDVICPGANGSTFDQTDTWKWLQDNSYKFGFILRYPKDKEYLTGYDYESWHYRYLGIDLATKVHESGLTYDEYYAYYLEDN